MDKIHKSSTNEQSSLIQINIKRIEYKVHGYIRRIQIALKIANTPPLVLFICLQYSKNEDYFSTKNPSLSITDNGKTITKIGDVYGWGKFAIGTRDIDTTLDLMAIWTLKVNRCIKRGLGIRFGLINPIDNDGVRLIVEVYNSGTTRAGWGFKSIATEKVEDKLMIFGEGDTFQFIIDTKYEEIKFKRNNDKDIVLFRKASTKVLNCKCRFGVGLYRMDNSVTITDFEIAYY